MKSQFDSRRGLVVVGACLRGPGGLAIVRLALDTGATMTLIAPAHLQLIGAQPIATGGGVRVTTGSGVVQVTRITVPTMEALGQARADFPVIAHSLPQSAGVDGLLGLDFMRGLELTVDFRTGEVGLQ